MDFAKILRLFSTTETAQSTDNVLNEGMKMVTGPGGKKVPAFAADGKGAKDLAKKAKDKDKVEESEEVIDEVTAPGQEAWVKANKKRFVDQYGKKKGMSVLYATAWKRSKGDKATESIEECWDQAMSSTTPAQESGMTINASFDTKTGNKSVTVSAQGEAADQLSEILRLSGMHGSSDESDESDEFHGDEEAAEQHSSDKPVEFEIEMDEEYANEPHPEVLPASVQFQQGNDLNRPKTMHKNSYRQGDNPMAMAEAAAISEIEERLMEELASIKTVSKIATRKKK